MIQRLLRATVTLVATMEHVYLKLMYIPANVGMDIQEITARPVSVIRLKNIMLILSIYDNIYFCNQFYSLHADLMNILLLFQL